MSQIGITSVVAALVLCITMETKSENVIAMLGSTTTLDCKIEQKQFLVWDRPTSPLTTISIQGKIQNITSTSKYSIVQSISGRQSLVIHNIELTDDGFYRCYDLSNASLRNEFKVNIFVQPVNISISGPLGIVNEGSKQEIYCDVIGSKPPPVIRWYLIDFTQRVTELRGVDYDTIDNNGIDKRRNVLRLNVTRNMFRGTFVCNASVPFFYHIHKEIKLDINLLPQIPTILRFTGLFDDGTIASIQCDSTGSRPAANISWFLDGRKLHDVRQQISQETDGTYTTSGFLTIQLSKEMDGKVLTCATENKVLLASGKLPVTTNVTLLAMYVPRLSGENGTKVVKENDSVSITCSIDARPPSTQSDITWSHDYQLVPRSRLKLSNVTHPELHISSVQSNDRGIYRCKASNRLGIGTGPPLKLDVLYRPKCIDGRKQKYAVKLGDLVKLRCIMTSNPTNVTMTWRYITSPAPIKQNIQGIQSDDSVYTTINLYIRNEQQFTDIECIASNTIGTSSKSCLFQLLPPGPPEIPSNCTISQKDESNLQVQCLSGFDGGSAQTFILQQLLNSRFKSVQNHTSPYFVVSDISPGVNYTFRTCTVTSLYWTLSRCSDVVSYVAPFIRGDGKENEQIASASLQENGPYIAAGVVGFLALCCIIGVIVFFYRRSKQKNRPPRFRYTWEPNGYKHGDHFQEVKHVTHDGVLEVSHYKGDNHHNRVDNRADDWDYNRRYDYYMGHSNGSLSSRSLDDLPPELSKLAIMQQKSNNLNSSGKPANGSVSCRNSSLWSRGDSNLKRSKSEMKSNKSENKSYYSEDDVRAVADWQMKCQSKPCQRSMSMDYMRSKEVGEGETFRIHSSLILKPEEIPVHVRQYRVSHELPSIIREDSTPSVSSHLHRDDSIRSNNTDHNNFTGIGDSKRRRNSYDKAVQDAEFGSYSYLKSGQPRAVNTSQGFNEIETVRSNTGEPITDLDADTTDIAGSETLRYIESALPREVKEFLSNALYPEHDDLTIAEVQTNDGGDQIFEVTPNMTNDSISSPEKEHQQPCIDYSKDEEHSYHIATSATYDKEAALETVNTVDHFSVSSEPPENFYMADDTSDSSNPPVTFKTTDDTSDSSETLKPANDSSSDSSDQPETLKTTNDSSSDSSEPSETDDCSDRNEVDKTISLSDEKQIDTTVYF